MLTIYITIKFPSIIIKFRLATSALLGAGWPLLRANEKPSFSMDSPMQTLRADAQFYAIEDSGRVMAATSRRLMKVANLEPDGRATNDKDFTCCRNDGNPANDVNSSSGRSIPSPRDSGFGER